MTFFELNLFIVSFQNTILSVLIYFFRRRSSIDVIISLSDVIKNVSTIKPIPCMYVIPKYLFSVKKFLNT